MWKIKGDTSHGTKGEVMSKMKKELENLKELVESIVDIEVGINYETSDMAYDIVLYSVFKDQEGLQAYQEHPEHQRIANELVSQVSLSRAVVDYII